MANDNALRRIRVPWAVAAAATVTLAAGLRAAEPEERLAVHDVSLWIIDPGSNVANARSAYPSALPVTVNSVRSGPSSLRSRRVAPINLLTFHGRAVENLDVDLRTNAGSFLAHWPPGDSLPNRLRWSGAPAYNLVKKIEDETELVFVDSDDWIAKARGGDALYVKRGARSERFLAYDVELKLDAPVRLEGGPDKFKVINTSGATLYDVLIACPTPEGCRVAWIDVLPRGESSAPAAAPVKPDSGRKLFGGLPAGTTGSGLFGGLPAPKPGPGVEITFSEPLAAESAAAAAKTTEALSTRLAKAGLTADESERFVDHYGSLFFETETLVVACRLDPATIEEKLPLSVFPMPASTVRVAMVLVRNADPRMGEAIGELIAQLGDPKFAVREAAQKRLMALGPLAFEALQQALNHSDVEIVIRSERILLNQNQTPNASAAVDSNGRLVPGAIRAAPVIINR